MPSWSEPLLVAHTTLLEISCCNSYMYMEADKGSDYNVDTCTILNMYTLDKTATLFVDDNTNRHPINIP